MRCLVLVLLVLAGACSGKPANVEIEPLPQLDLARFEPGLQQRIGAATANLPIGTVAATGENAQPWFEAAQLLQAHGIENLALASYRNTIELQPGHDEARYLAAYLEHQAGNLEAALANYDEVLGNPTLGPTAAIRSGEIHLQRGEPALAETAFQTAERLQPGLAAVASGLGRAALARQDYAAARDFLEQALKKQPDADQLNYPLALSYRGLGDLERARDLMSRRGTRPARVPDPALDTVRSRASTSQVHIKAGLAAYENGDLETAAAEYRRALDLNPGLVDTHLALAWVLEQLGQTEDAFTHTRTTLQLDPERALAHHLLGRLHERAGDDRAAAESYRLASTDPGISPPVPSAELLAGALMRLGDYASAAPLYADLAASDPESARLQYLHGLALLATGDCAAAAVPLDRARRLSPGSAEAAEAWIRTTSSCAPADRRATVALAAELFSALPEAPFAEAYAMALASNGQFDRAVQLQQRVAANTGNSYSNDLLERFRNGKTAERPWPDNAPAFHPPRISD